MARVIRLTEENRTIRLGDAVFSYRLLRETRRTLTMKQGTEGLEVHAPERCRDEDVEAFMRRNLHWLKTSEARMREIRDWQSRFRFCDGGRCLFLGEWVELRLQGEKTELVEAGGRRILRLALPPGASEARIRGLVRGWLVAQAARTYPERVTRLAEKAGRAPAAIHLSEAQSYWGQCDRSRRIRLSWRLILFEAGLIDYVIAHELAHLTHMNHSARFWAHVEAIDPQWRKYENMLKTIHMKWIPL